MCCLPAFASACILLCGAPSWIFIGLFYQFPCMHVFGQDAGAYTIDSEPSNQEGQNNQIHRSGPGSNVWAFAVTCKWLIFDGSIKPLFFFGGSCVRVL